MLSSTLLDDFGLKPLKSPHDEDLHDLIDERYERGAATLDRLRHNAYRMVLEGESYRSPRPLLDRQEKDVEKGGEIG